MSTFAQKALQHVSGSRSKLSILDGREGVRLKAIATRLQIAYDLTTEQIEDYYDAFVMFPLDSNQRISPSSMFKFYANADVELSEENCLNAMRAFTNIQNIESLDFETYVVSLERWMKKDIHYSEVMKMAFKVYDDSDGTNAKSVEGLLKTIDGPTLTCEEIQMLAEEGNT